MAADSYADWLELPRDAVEMIPNALQPDVYADTNPIATAALSARLEIDAGTPLLAGIFRLVPEKGAFDFVEVAARLHRRYPALRTILCGVGPLRQAIERDIAARGLEGKIVLIGAVDDVGALYRRATLLLHTAHFEGMPNVIMEAQACGLPVVCTRVGGTPACLSPQLIPFMRDAGDCAGLTDSCVALLDDPTALDALRHQVAAEVRKRFSVAGLVANTLAAVGLQPQGQA
jgi:glycosyltransferase involved in cell wall biosynthesis